MTKTVVIEGLEYTASNGRMRYNPEFHDNHKAPWSQEDLEYLCGMWCSKRVKDISMALGRTESTCLTKVYELRRSRKFGKLRKRFKNE